MTIFRLRSHSGGLGLSPRRRKAPGPGGPGIVQDGLIAEWRFDEGAGQVLTDYTGNGHHGRLGSTAGIDPSDPAWSSEGLVFTAADGDFVECDNAGISGGVARTVIAALRTSTDPNPSNGAFGLEWRGTGTAGSRWTLRQSGSGLSGKLRWETNAVGINYSSNLVTGLSAGGGDWHFLGAAQSGSNANTIRLFVNGAFENVTVDFVMSTAGNFFWGTRNSSPESIRAAYGLIYSRALSDQEIEQNRLILKTILAGRGITLP